MSLKHLAQFFSGVGPSIAGIFYPSPDTHLLDFFPVQQEENIF
jgi:hypothetical protein